MSVGSLCRRMNLIQWQFGQAVFQNAVLTSSVLEMRTLPAGCLLHVSLVSWIEQSNGRKTVGEQSYTVPWRWTLWLNREGLSLLLQGFISSLQRDTDLKKIDFYFLLFTHWRYLWSSFWTAASGPVSLSAPPQPPSLVGRGTARMWATRLTCLLFANRTWHRQHELKNNNITTVLGLLL